MMTEEPVTHVLRSLLFVPVHRPRFVERAPSAGADVVCLDLEDSVPWDEKPRARDIAKETIPEMPRTGYLLFVRVNGLYTGLLEKELDAIVGPQLDGISLPKTDSARTVRQVDAYLTELEKARGLPVGQVKIIPWIETAIGLVNAYEIAPLLRASSRLFGERTSRPTWGSSAPPTAKRLSTPARPWPSPAWRPARCPLTRPSPTTLTWSTWSAMSASPCSLGYRGKYCIHPTQVEIVNRVFSPAPEEVEEARQLVDAFEQEGIAKGLAAIAVDGKMIDTPIYLAGAAPPGAGLRPTLATTPRSSRCWSPFRKNNSSSSHSSASSWRKRSSRWRWSSSTRTSIRWSSSSR